MSETIEQTATVATAQPAPIEMSITAGTLSEMFLSLDGHDKAQPGYDWRKGWNDAIRQAMDYAQPTPSVPDGWLRAVDEALVTAHSGVANTEDTYEQAKAKLDNLIGFHVDVATDPAVNGGYKLVPAEPTLEMVMAGEDAWDKQLDVRLDGSTRRYEWPSEQGAELCARVAYRAMLAAAPEAKP